MSEMLYTGNPSHMAHSFTPLELMQCLGGYTRKSADTAYVIAGIPKASRF